MYLNENPRAVWDEDTIPDAAGFWFAHGTDKGILVVSICPGEVGIKGIGILLLNLGSRSCLLPLINYDAAGLNHASALLSGIAVLPDDMVGAFVLHRQQFFA